MRKLRRRIFPAAFLLLLVLVALFPYYAVVQPFRDLVLRAVLPRINGTVTSGGASLGWLSAVEFRDIEVRSPDGTPVLNVPRLLGDRPVWRYLIGGEIGNLRLERPQLSIVMFERGSNVGQLFAADPERPEGPLVSPDLSLGLDIVDGILSFRSRGAPEPWTVDGFNLALALQPSTEPNGEQPDLILREKAELKRAPVTPAMCDDLLKYIAPVLAEATDVSGEVSIELDKWRSPLWELHKGQCSGRLVVHTVDVGSGPLVRALIRQLNLPPVRLADESPVEFQMADGRVHHQNLAFGVGQLLVHTHGSVGLDQTLDLDAEIPMPAETLRGVPLPESLKTRTLRLPVRGTLREPKIDPVELGTSNADLLLTALGEFVRKRASEDGTLLKRLLDPKATDETPLLDRIRQRPLLDRFRQRREQRTNQQ